MVFWTWTICWGDPMDKGRIRELLPEKPPSGLVEWTRAKHGRSELGGEFCVFHSERMSQEPTLQEIMEYNSLAPRRKEWAAVCTCTACGEDFITQKEPGMSAIRLVTGEDGWTYTLNIGEPVDPYMGIEVNREGDSLNCPLCGSEIRLIHTKHLRGGRMKQLMVASVQNVEGYTAVIRYQKKITTGFKDGKLKGKFGVDANCTRGQIVTFLYRAR